MTLFSGEAAPGLGPAAEAPFCRRQKGAPKRRSEHQLPRILLTRFGHESPARPRSPAPPWPYETRPCRSASARFASFWPPHLVVPAQAHVR